MLEPLTRPAVCVSMSAVVMLVTACARDKTTDLGPPRVVSEDAPSPATHPPRRYASPYATTPIVIDGRLDDAGWSRASWSDVFVDIEGDRKPRPRHDTRMKIAWDDQFLYVGARLDEPHVWGTLTEHDEIVFHDNDFEVFIDPDGDRAEYYEVEVNALNTIFDLLLERTYIDGGPAKHGWHLDGMKTAIHVDGTLNDPSDTDRAWSVELAMPWTTLAERANRPSPPNPGDEWRINFSRVQWRHMIVDGAYEKIPDLAEDNWVWSPQGVVNMHLPEHWGYVVFVK
jgi:hypothetical protein